MTNFFKKSMCFLISTKHLKNRKNINILFKVGIIEESNNDYFYLKGFINFQIQIK